jgi:hypothetical protein
MKWFLIFCFGVLAGISSGQTYEEQAVAAILMGEAWSEGEPGMTAVAEVIHQRPKKKVGRRWRSWRRGAGVVTPFPA